MMITFNYPKVTDLLLEQIVDKIVAGFDPDKIILFGSQAWGQTREDSDVDLLVIMESDLRPAQRSAQVSMACRPKGLAMDIIVKTPAEIERRMDMGDLFLRRIIDQGKLVYARTVGTAVDQQS